MSSRKRILLFPDNPSPGGISSYCIALLREYQRFNDLEVRIAAFAPGPGGWLADRARECGAEIKLFRMSHALGVRPIFEIASYLAAEQIDLVHTQAYRSGIMAGAAVRLLGPRHVKLVRTVHGIPVPKDRKGGFYETLGLWSIFMADKVIAVCAHTQEWLAARGVDQRKIIVVRNGIDAYDLYGQENTHNSEIDLGNDKIVVGYIGRLVRGKGLEVLVEAAAQIIAESNLPVIFLIVGDGPLGEELKRRVESRTLSGFFRFVGSQDDLSFFYRLCDIVVLPSFSEGIPMSLLEAMCWSKPVVATAVGGIREVITDGISGLLVQPGDVCALAAAILELVRRPAMRKTMGEQARSVLINEFSAQRMAYETVAVYRDLLG